MSLAINNLFNFGRTLPAPFDSLGSKKVKVTSKYGEGTESTLCATVIKAIHAICHCMDGSGDGAVGVMDKKTVAEYKSSAGNDYHLVVYDSTNGQVLASIYNKDTEVMETYTCNPSARDGSAIMMALFPVLMQDDEFSEKFEEYYKEYTAGYPDVNHAKECMAYLCDNAYRRVKNDTIPQHIKVEIERSGNLMRISPSHIDSGTFTPKEVVAGEFTIFASIGSTTVIGTASEIVAHADFEGQYVLQPRSFNPIEQSLIPKLPSWYIIPQEVVDICKHAKATTGKPTQMRNFLLRGPAGTGKTMGAKAIAAGLGLPYMKYTCSAGTEIFDFIGQVFPNTDGFSSSNPQIASEREMLKAMGGINYANVAKLMSLPDLDDMDYDSEGVYERLTGIKKPNASSQDCMAVVLDIVTAKVQELMKSDETTTEKGQSFRYVETDFINALRNGFVVEIQEPTTIVQPGVMVGLNSLLEQDGSITLPTGEIIKRHPDAVVVVTTNVSYEGCRGMNQSIIDRMSLVRDVELPEPEVMVQRAMSVTGATDELMVSDMVKVVNDMADYCRKNSITDGSVGMRSLIDWIVSTEITGDVYSSALQTIVSKATADEDDREALIATVLEPIFARGRKKR